MSTAKAPTLVPNPQPVSRPVYFFDVPEQMAGITKIKSVGVHELTVQEEKEVNERAKNTVGMTMVFEMARAALCEVDGKPVSLSDGTTDVAWVEMGAPMRELVAAAAGQVNTPPQGALDAFLKSRQVRVR